MNLAKEISFLLYQHDCVILPEFGAFIVRRRESEKNEIALYAKPFSHSITFNNQIKNNDGLLVNRISVINNCSFSEAVILVKDAIAKMQTEISLKKNLELSNVGTFYLTQEGKLIFIPYHSLNFCKASFGLPKLKLSKLTKSMDQEKNKPTGSRPSIPSTSPKLAPNEIDTPLLVQKQQENKRKYEELQAKRLAKRNEALNPDSQTRKWNGLKVINTLGSLFLIAMIIGLFLFEKNISDQQAANDQIASILNPADNGDSEFNESIATDPMVTETINDVHTFGIYASTVSSESARIYFDEISDKYKQAKISESNNEVFIISFDNEELANEYKNLLQNKTDYKLIVK